MDTDISIIMMIVIHFTLQQLYMIISIFPAPDNKQAQRFRFMHILNNTAANRETSEHHLSI